MCKISVLVHGETISDSLDDNNKQEFWKNSEI